jgi:hypothetical protein
MDGVRLLIVPRFRGDDRPGFEPARLFWLGVNLLVGLVFVPLAVGLARLLGRRFRSSPVFQRLLDDLAGAACARHARRLNRSWPSPARLKPWNARPRAINSAVASTSPSLKLCPSKVGKEELATFLELGRCQHLKLGLQKFVCATAAKIRDGRPGYQEERGDNKHGHGSPWLVARVCSMLPTAWPGTIMEQCPLRCSPQSCTARRPVRRGCCGPT